ncbi:MAG: acyltransferase [Bacteroides sp.]|nr:acyltransferase [Bacteroides sp.]
MSRNDLRSQSLDLLRFPLAVVVLVIHIFNTEGFTIQGNTISLENMPILLEVNRFIDGFLRGQSVPIYFFISGFVFFLGIELTREKYFQKLKNRLKTLLIPYIIWNIVDVLILLTLFLPCFSSLVPNLYKVRLDFSLPAILQTFWNAAEGIFVRPLTIVEAVGSSIYPQYIPLWFVRDLMIVVLCTPLLYWLLRRTRHYLVGILGILWFTLAYWDLGHINQLLTAFFFFMWGAYMSVNKKDMMHEFYRFFKSSMILYPLLALLFVASVHYWPAASDTIKRLNVFVGLFFAYNAASWLLRHGVCKVSPFLAASSFFVYVTHELICSILLKLLFLIFRPATDLGLLFLYLFTVVFTVVFLLLVFYLLRRYSPSFLKVIAGRK